MNVRDKGSPWPPHAAPRAHSAAAPPTRPHASHNHARGVLQPKTAPTHTLSAQPRTPLTQTHTPLTLPQTPLTQTRTPSAPQQQHRAPAQPYTPHAQPHRTHAATQLQRTTPAVAQMKSTAAQMKPAFVQPKAAFIQPKSALVQRHVNVQPPQRNSPTPPVSPRPAQTAGVIQRASTPRRSARIASVGYVHAVINLIAGLLIRPPSRDKHGTRYWNGYRNDVRWTGTTTAHMAPTKGGGCQVGGAKCAGTADGIDHIVDFATTQSALPTHTFCDGAQHWTGVLHTDAQADYNNTANLRWSCISCNSSKSGARGLYSPPRHAGACPGATCTL